MKLLHLRVASHSLDSVDNSTFDSLTADNIRSQPLRKGLSVMFSMRSGSMQRAMDGPLPTPCFLDLSRSCETRGTGLEG
jgi:hypothetical protein